LQEIDRYACENVHKVLVGNKCDMVSERKATTKEAQEFADQLNLEFLETSAKNATNVEEAFSKMANSINTFRAKPHYRRVKVFETRDARHFFKSIQESLK